MISMALVGLTDHRHRHLLSPLHRRRAGVRMVAVSDPDPEALAEWTEDRDVPGYADHRELLAEAQPSLVAVVGLAAPTVVIADALRSGADVIATPPFARSVAELDDLLALAETHQRRLTPLHTFRSHQTSRLAKELIDAGKLAAKEVVVMISEDLTGPRVDEAVVDGIDLYSWLTGCRFGHVSEFQIDGDPMLELAGESMDGAAATLTIVRGGQAPEAPVAMSVGNGVARVEWEVNSGLFHSRLADRDPVLLSCGLPADVDEWVFTNLVRVAEPTIRGVEADLATRILGVAGESTRTGFRETWGNWPPAIG